MKLLKIALLSIFAISAVTVTGFTGPAYACGGPCPPDPEPDEKGNNGWGNGDQSAPGNSENSNGAENKGGNADNTGDAPGNSGH